MALDDEFCSAAVVAAVVNRLQASNEGAASAPVTGARPGGGTDAAY
jgi:hypothetical protein